MPTPYNIVLDCVDSKAQDEMLKDKTALAFFSGTDQHETGVKITYKNLSVLTNHAANAFSHLGIKPQERVAIRLGNVPEYPVAFFGAMKIQALPVVLSTELTAAELKELLSDCKASLLVTQADEVLVAILKHPPRTLRKILVVTSKDQIVSKRILEQTLDFRHLLITASRSFVTQATSEDAAAYCLYTSGTAGKAKSVVHAHRSIPAHDLRVQKWLDLKSGDAILNTSALNWSYALTATMMDVLRHGCTALFCEHTPTAHEIIALINKYNITTLMTVPGLYQRLVTVLKENPTSLPALRVCLSAGEKLSKETRKDFFKLTGKHIFEGIGMTENSVYIVQEHDKKPVEESCGKILSDKNVCIVNKKLSPVKSGETGVLAIDHREKGLMLGYGDFSHKKPSYELPLKKGWFITGDLAMQDKSGNVFFKGRSDDLITAGGFRIAPQEVEAVLEACRFVAESAVVTCQLRSNKTIVGAAIVRTAEAKKEKNLEMKILKHCETKLAHYKIPRKILFVDSLPKTKSGKIKRSAVRV